MKISYEQNDEGYFYSIADENDSQPHTLTHLKRQIISQFRSEAGAHLDVNESYEEYDISIYRQYNISDNIVLSHNIDDEVMLQVTQDNKLLYNLVLYGWTEKNLPTGKLEPAWELALKH